MEVLRDRVGGGAASLTASWPENYISRDSSIQLNSQESAQSALVFRQGHHLSPQPSSWKPLPVLRIYILLQVWVDVFGVLSPRHLHDCVSRPELDRYFVDPFWISMNSSIFLSLPTPSLLSLSLLISFLLFLTLPSSLPLCTFSLLFPLINSSLFFFLCSLVFFSFFFFLSFPLIFKNGALWHLIWNDVTSNSFCKVKSQW